MDLKGIIAKHVDPVAREHGTTWDEILDECRRQPGNRQYRKETVAALAVIYRMSLLTSRECLKQIYNLKMMPQHVEDRVDVKKAKVW